MENKKNILEELEKEAPFLSKIKKENNYHTPKNYFKSLPEAVTHKKLNDSFLKIVFDNLSYKILVPTTTIIALLFIVLNFNTNNISTEITSEQLSELIIDENYFEMDDDLVYEAYAELLDEETQNTSEDDDYINYLIENDIDINSIIEEL